MKRTNEYGLPMLARGRKRIEIVPQGPSTYLWVGEEGENEGDSYDYFGAFSGRATLRKFAKAILAEVGES